MNDFAKHLLHKRNYFIVVSVLMLFTLASGLLTIQSAADDKNNGSRNSARAPKALTTGTPADAKGQNPEHPDSQTLTLSPQAVPKPQPQVPRAILAIADFDLLGLAVTINPASQTVPKNTPTIVTTSVQTPLGTDPAQIIATLNANYRVRGELTGPSFTSPLAVEAKIGQALNIPALSRAGDHLLQNLRVVDTGLAGNPVVATVSPDSAGITVIDQLLVSEVRVEEMTYDEIIQSGINITDDSYQFFNFVLALGTSSTPVNVNIPVAFPTVGGTEPPVVGRPSVPSGIGTGAPPPFFGAAPVMLEMEEAGGTRQEISFGGGPIRIPGVVVFPGRIGFLHQFFEAIVIVANGAPNGTPLVVKNLRAQVVLPNNGTPNDATDDPLRIATTQTGGQVSELQIRGLGTDGVYGTADDVVNFAAGQSGQASFLLEGLKEGLHSPNFKLTGTLEGLPIGPVTVSGEVPGAVLVRDASFSVSFSHPSIVRAGNDYDLAMTLYNSGTRVINGAVAKLNPNGISGANLLGNDNGERAFATSIQPKASSTVVWRLKANVTGAVTASYVKVGEGIEAGLNLKTGVGDRNIPLSPDSLILPDEVRFLPPEVVEAGRALLGQAWSIANAPRGSLPQGVTAIDPFVVIEKAQEIGIAGLRVEFNEPTQVSLGTLMRDWLGENSTTALDPGFADAMRDTVSGFNWYDSLGTYLYGKLTAAQAPTLVALHQELGNAEVPRSPFLSALITQPSGAPIFGARLVNPTGQRAGFVNSANERLGEIATAASLQLRRADAGATNGQMLLATRPVDGNWTLELTAWQTGTVDISLLVPASSHVYRQVVFSGVALTAGTRYRIVLRPNSTNSLTLEEFRNGAFQATSATPTVSTLNEGAPRLVGVLQVTPEILGGGDQYGRLVGLLFSKPMQKATAETASRYTVGGGEVIGANPPVSMVGKINVAQAKLDLGGRFVFLGLDATVGGFVRRDLTLRGIADARGVELPSPTTSPITITVSPQGNPPGAYLTGRVLLADGTPVANAPVAYYVPPCDRIVGKSAAIEGGSPITVQRTDSQGRYSIDYVRNGNCGAPYFKAANPTNGSQKQIGTPVVYHGQHLNLDLVFLARGKVSGAITISGAPAANAFVRVVPSLESAAAVTVQADGLGRYLVEDIPVGQVSVLAVGAGSQANATGLAAGTIEGPNQTAVVNVALQSLAGVVRGRVLNSDTTPSVGALVIAQAQLAGFTSIDPAGFVVGYGYTGRDGSFTITNLPVTTITLTVSDAVTGLRLTQMVQLSQTTPEVNGIVLTLPGYGSISGRVLDETGSFVPFALVFTAGGAVVADGLGFYSIPRITAGTYSVTAKDSLSDAAGSTSATVRLNENTANVNITITRPGTITGQVFIQNAGAQPTPVAEATVTYDGTHQVQTDAQGRYTLRGIPANRVFTLRFVHANRRLAVNFDAFVNANETISRNATFKPSSVRGKISQPDGTTGTVAELKLRVPLPETDAGPGFGLLNGKDISTQSAGDGVYLVSNLNAGVYRVTASNSFFPVKVSKGGTLLGNEEQVCNLSLVNTLAGKIQGRVFQPDGTTPVGAGINVALGGGTLADVTVRTDQTGRYEFAEVFAEGNYILTATDATTGYSNRISIAVRSNQDVIADLRLLGRGGLRVRVIDGAGNPVTGGSINVDGTLFPNHHRFAELSAQTGNVVLFDNISEGSYAVVASQNGLSGRASADVPLGSTVELTIQLQASGSIEGRVLMPDGTTPIPFADVTLILNNRAVGVSVTSDADGQVGKFSFANVPAGEFTLEAFDNRTGRRARTSGSITSQGQIATADLKLIAVGAVTGIVRLNGVPVDHALVTITASGLTTTRLSATTSSDGRYRFTGIAAGQFIIEASNGVGGLTGSATGTITGTAEPLPDTVVDIALTPSVTVTGNVYKLGGVETVNGARVTLRVGQRQFQTTTNQSGAYRIEFVPLGELRLRADAPTGYNRGEAAPVTATQAGATHTIHVTLAGTGSVSGIAQDNNGTALTSGTVNFTNDAFGTPIVIAAQVQANGRYEIRDVPAGNFSLRLTVPNRPEVGVASGTIVANQTLDLNIKLEDAGTVSGTVKQPDGVTNAASVDVKLSLTRSGSTIVFYTHTNAQGLFSFANVPLGTISISVSDVAGGGVAFASGTLATNGQPLNVGTLILDNAAISVATVTPINNATNVARNTTVVVVFSEAALASSVNSSSVKLLQGANQVGANVALSGDGKTVTLTPASLLGDFTGYTLVVTTAVADLTGHNLAAEFRSSFVTKDETGPVVTAVSPVNNATSVALASDVLITFNEVIDRAQNLSSVVSVSFGAAPGTSVAGTVTLDTAGLVATFHPTNPLAESTIYTVRVTGQRDILENVQTAVFTSSFTTVDQTPPVIDPLPIDGTRQGTLRPIITATYGDTGSGISILSVVLKLDGFTVTSGATVTGTNLSYQPPTSLATGVHTVTVQVADHAGNQSLIRTASFTIDNASPTLSIFTIGGVLAVNGMTVSSTLQPTFIASYTDDTGVNTSATRLLFGAAGATPPQVAATVTATGLSFTPASALAEGWYVAEVIVVDNTGNQTSSGQIQFRIDVDAPEITSVTPANGSQHGGTTVTLTGNRLLNSNGTAPSSVMVGGWPAQILSATIGSKITPVNTTASNFAAGSEPARAIDGNPATFWNAGNYPPQFIQLDLGATYAISLVRLRVAQSPNGQTVHEIYGGPAPESLTLLRTLNGNTVDDQVLEVSFTPAATNVRYLQIKTTASPSWVAWREIEVFNADASSADQLVIVTPAGAPGATTISVTTDRGAGAKPNAFTYDADPKTPFAVEADTVMLWRLDETSGTRVLDSGRLSIDGTATGASTIEDGRFGKARRFNSGGYMVSDNAFNALNFGANSFTLEVWTKLQPATVIQYLAWTSPSAFQLVMQPSGALEASVINTSGQSWQAVMPASAFDVDDNNWHSVAMVVDRQAKQLTIYVDGVARATAAEPVNFGAQRTTSNIYVAESSFRGVLDEVRLSASAHSATQIQQTYLGTQGSLGLLLSNFSPKDLPLNATTELNLLGYNLSGALAVVTDSAGRVIPSQVLSSSATQLKLQITTDTLTATGNAQISISSPAGSATGTVRVIDLSKSVGGVEPDTVLLWRLDETSGTRVLDSGRLSIDGTATGASTIEDGRFGKARRFNSGGYMVSDNAFNALNFGANSFTLEVWTKLQPATVIQYLAWTSPSAFQLVMQPSGALEASVINTSGQSWQAVMPASAFDVDDNNWHSVAMVVDRQAKQLTIYVDGVARATAAEPANFGAQRTTSNIYVAESSFRGVLDEVRLSASAHSATRILNDYIGTNGMQISSYTPKAIVRDTTTTQPVVTQISLDGYDLDGISARVERSGQPLNMGVSIIESSSRHATLSLAVDRSVALGLANLIISKASQPEITLSINIVEPSRPALEPDTVLLWHVDETSGTRVLDSGRLSIDGTATGASTIEDGRFGKARRFNSGGYMVSDNAFNALNFGANSFTLEVWTKLQPATVIQYLAWTSPSAFQLVMQPSGALEASVTNTSGQSWQAATTPVTYTANGPVYTLIDDNNWHSVAMVVDRQAKQLTIYVDGVARATATEPANFGALRSTTSVFVAESSFRGVLDEVRLSASAHSAEKVASDYFGFDGVQVSLIQPMIVQKGASQSPITLHGKGLTNASVTSSRPDVTVQLTSSSSTQLDFKVSVPGAVPTGSLPFTVTNVIGQTTTFELTVVDQQPFVNGQAPNDTILLWHMDETSGTQVMGSGDLAPSAVIQGTAPASSVITNGRFGNGRGNAQVTGDANSTSLDLSTTDFTIDLWLNSDFVSSAATLLQKNFTITLQPSGALQVTLVDTSGRTWQAEVAPVTYASNGPLFMIVTDKQWHLVTVVLTSAPKLTIYVDGVQRVSADPPATGFGILRNIGYSIQTGFSFPGTLDEIRIVNFARTAAQISDTWFGTTSVAMSPSIFTILQKALVGRDKEKPNTPLMLPPKPPLNLPPPDTGRNARATGGGR